MPKKSFGSVTVFYPEYSREEVIQLLRERLPILNAHLRLRFVALFGSYATDTYTAFSDIDLLVVYEGEVREDAFALVKKTLQVRGLEPHVLNVDEFRAVFPTWQRMLKDGISLWGEMPSL